MEAPEDKNNTFAVGFQTIPWKSDGVAHILEHTALCGSHRFPVRDPFFNMIRRSLATFMNAFTGPDFTLYPFSTQNRTDFRNLLGVYLDAAFFPLLTAKDFAQEGHRLEREDEDGKKKLVIKGVVYNEMKGAMADASSLFQQHLETHLLEGTTYAVNSGGEPAVIPELTHQELVRFHRDHYNINKAHFFTYGDIPLEEHLDYVVQYVLNNNKEGTALPARGKNPLEGTR